MSQILAVCYVVYLTRNCNLLLSAVCDCDSCVCKINVFKHKLTVDRYMLLTSE